MNADELNLITLAQRFADDETARKHLESLRWPNGVPICPFCGGEGYRMERKESCGRKAQPGVCKCRNKECRKQFTVTKGTVFESSHVKIGTWLMCMFIMCASKKAVSAHQIHRMLGVTYKTAWFMCHRIRYAMDEGPLKDLLSGTVEVDETYVGGKRRGCGHLHSLDNKTPVVSLVERGGRKRSVVMPKVIAVNLRAAVNAHVVKGSNVHTDEHKGYKSLKHEFKHGSVNHSANQYVRRFRDGSTITTNTVESSFSLLKRGIIGAFHHVSEKHLHRYCAEFDFRWNQRKVSDGARATAALTMIEGKRLKYRDS
jgi:transposase-like protein